MAAESKRLRAIGYVRVSTALQKKGYSPEVQEQKIRDFCKLRDYELLDVVEEVEKGWNNERPVYQGILKAARERGVDRIVPIMLDRFWRDAGEALTQWQEMKNRRVLLDTVDEGLIDTFETAWMRAGMAAMEVRRTAKRVIGARVLAAKAGTHCGPTPYGFNREYPSQPAEGSRRPQAVLVENPGQADGVRRLFGYVASGRPKTLRQIALWANEEGRIPRPESGKAWTRNTVEYLLRNPVYVGDVAYNRYPSGEFERAGEGEDFVAGGKHKPLISRELWDAVQARLNPVRQPRTRRGRDGTFSLAAGLLVCAECGGRMTAVRGRGSLHQRPAYSCISYRLGRSDCSGGYIRQDVANAALLAQVKRLRWHPWNRDAVLSVLPAEEQAEAIDALSKRFAAVQAAAEAHNRLVDLLSPAEDGETLREAREQAQKLYDMGRALERELAKAQAAGGVGLDQLEALHGAVKVTHNRLKALKGPPGKSMERVLATAEAGGDEAGLRELVLPLVRSARIVERVPERRTTWARAEVEWTHFVFLLLLAGVLSLAPDVRPEA